MAPFLKAEQCTHQLFETKDGGPLQQLPVHVCPDTGDLCIFWQDVQNAFLGIDYVGYAQSDNTVRVPFMVDRYSNVLHPLRIFHKKASYRVLYRDHQRQLTPALELRYLYQSWKDAAKNMEEERIEYIHIFLRISENAEYHLSKLLKHLELMREIRIKIEVDGKLEDQILDEIQEHQQNASVCEYQSACNEILKSMDSTTPRRFLVLPADLSSWEDSDPTTHQFRLYFLCDTLSNPTHQSNIPQHWHLSNHPGYILDRHQEFFQAFGGLALTMLKMVRQGASNEESRQGAFSEESMIPPLDTFEILWNVDPEIIGNRITKDTIRLLIDKSISYLQAVPVAKCERQFFWSMKSAAIKNFFVVPDGSNSLGGLCRSTQQAITHWTCMEHQYQWLSLGTMKTLVDFVQGCGGHIDIQRASLSIELRSRHQAEQLCTLLKTSEKRMDISIKIKWNASRRDLDGLVRDIVNANVYTLELDGVTHNMHPQGNTESRTDRITNYLSLMVGPQSVILLNYPQPQDQYIYLSPYLGIVFKFQLKQQQQVETKQSSYELESKLIYFTHAIMTNMRNDLLEVKAEQLQHILAETGYHTVPTISLYRRNWYGEFNITERTLQELRLHEFWADKPFVALEALASLRTLRMNVDDLMIHHEEISQMLQASLQLQDLIISLQENRALESIAKTVEMWQGRSSSLQLTLVEYDRENRGHVVAQIAISSHVSSHPRNSNPDFQGSDASCTKTEFLQWNSDHVWKPLANLTAALLDTATKSHPSVLRSFTLDISNLTEQEGLPHIQHILQQSMLRQFHICCTVFNGNLSDSVRQVLFSIRWDALSSLILSGTAVNEWIRILATITEPSLVDLQLQCLRIQGIGRRPIVLLHASVLFFHRLLYLNPLMELVMENVCLQDERTRNLVARSLHSQLF